MRKPKILIFDIETGPYLAYLWGLYDQNVALNQLKNDRHLMSFCAKWLGSKSMLYMDQRNEANIEDDRRLVKALSELLDAADIVITQNGKHFDCKIVNARIALHGLKPPSPYRHIDTFKLAKKHFGFTSNRLEYLSDKLNVKYKKQKHAKFSGFDLWKECLAGNMEAWKEMEKYNKYDVLATEELYTKLAPWGTGINFNVFSLSKKYACECGSTSFAQSDYHFTNKGKFNKYRCTSCGATHIDTENLLSKKKKDAIKKRKPL